MPVRTEDMVAPRFGAKLFDGVPEMASTLLV